MTRHTPKQDSSSNPQTPPPRTSDALTDGSGAAPGPLERDREAERTFPLKLTQKQRETLLQHAKLPAHLKSIVERPGEGTRSLDVTFDELQQLYDLVEDAFTHARGAERRSLRAARDRVEDAYFDAEDLDNEEEYDEGPDPLVLEARDRAAKTGRLFQFKIALLGVKPPVWRRVQVWDCTLDQLHLHIQRAMGWDNCHLHQFDIDGETYGDPDLLDDGFDEPECEFEDSTITTLGDLLPKSTRQALRYTYDFGDGWEHDVLFEGNPAPSPQGRYPVCLEGQRACPPEDCGGAWGYQNFLKVIRGPRNKERKELLQWVGRDFDSEEFSAEEATEAMTRKLPDEW